MERIATKIRKNGFDYTQILRGGRSLLYEQHVTPRIQHYEVFEIRKAPARIINGKPYPEKERFPGNEDFGKWAWSYTTLERAKKKYNELES
jgi:hypothetical protein